MSWIAMREDLLPEKAGLQVQVLKDQTILVKTFKITFKTLDAAIIAMCTGVASAVRHGPWEKKTEENLNNACWQHQHNEICELNVATLVFSSAHVRARVFPSSFKSSNN